MTASGIHTGSHHLDVLDVPFFDLNAFKWYLFYRWAAEHRWNAGQPPAFAGRYFLGGRFQWGHGEGRAAQESIRTQWRPLGPLGDEVVIPTERIAPIQAADPDRQSGVGPGGQAGVDQLAFWNGLTDGTALCRRLAACVTAGELSITDSFVYVFLDVAPGTALSTWYWAAWAHAVSTFALLPPSGPALPIQPFLPAICCRFVEDATTHRYSIDPPVAACLEAAQPTHPHLAARCWGFWAKAASRANLARPLDFGRFPEYRQPITAAESRPVWLLLWRYAEQQAPLDPEFVGGNWISLDAVNEPLGDLVVTKMLRIEDWSAEQLRDDRERPPLWMGVDKGGRFTAAEIDCFTGRDPASVVPVPLRIEATRRGVGIPFSGFVDFVMRYYARPGSWKLLTRAEVDELVSRGLRVGVFWQVGPHDWDDPGDSQGTPGYDHARQAFALAAELGQPAHTPVYFCPIDDDAAHIADAQQRAERYFSAVLAGYTQYLADQRVLGVDPRPYAIGVYGGAQVFNYVYMQGIASHFFQSCSEGWWGNGPVWAHVNGVQVNCLPNAYCGTIVDVDATWGDEGAWEPEP